MKKPKISLDMSKVQGMLLLHCEKLILGVVVLIAGWFVYQGYSIKGLDSNKTPLELKNRAENAVRHINDGKVWDEIAKTRLVPMDVPEKVSQGHKPADALAYRLPNAWNRSDFPKLSRRVDPKLFAPINLKVVPMVGPLAYYSDGYEKDPLDPMALMEAELALDGPPKPKPIPKRPAIDPITGMAMEGGPGRRPPRGRGGNRGSGEEVLDPTGSQYVDPNAGMMGPGSMEMGPGMMGGSGQPGMLNPESVLGYRPQGPVIAKPVRCVTVMAVVPIERQIEEFERSLAEALDYDQIRDQPRYLQFSVERTDVTADPFADLTTAKWEPLGVKASLYETSKWGGWPTEVVEPNYLDTAYFDPNTMTTVGVLTHPAPPFMQRDLWEVLTHPDVPLPPLAIQEFGPDGRPILPTYEGETPEFTDELPSFPTPGQGGMMPGMMGSEGGYGGPGGGGMRPSPQRPTMPVRPGMGGSGSGMYGSEGGQTYGANGSLVPVVSKYKLLRFNDMTVQQGHIYRYRVRLWLEDPNHPSNVAMAPSVQSLDDPVRERVKTQEADDGKRADKRRTFWRLSDWSEPSEPVELPASDSFYAKSVTAPPMSVVMEGRPRIQNKEHAATTLAVVWDDKYVVDVPAPIEVLRGSTLNFTADAQVIHPAMAAQRKLAKYNFATQAVVADIAGGEVIPPLQKGNDKPLSAPGEILLFDQRGNLQARHETDDIEALRRFEIPEPPKPVTSPGGEFGSDPAGGGFSDLLGPGPGPGPMPGRSRRERGP